MTRVIYSLERNLAITPTPPVTIPAATATEILSDSRQSVDEIATIEVENIGTKDAYYAYGRACDGTVNVDGILYSGQTVVVPVRLSVSLYSVDGTSVAIRKFRRSSAISNLT